MEEEEYAPESSFRRLMALDGFGNRELSVSPLTIESDEYHFHSTDFDEHAVDIQEALQTIEAHAIGEGLPGPVLAFVLQYAQKEIDFDDRVGLQARFQHYIDLVTVLADFSRRFLFSNASVALLTQRILESDDFPAQLSDLITRILHDDQLELWRPGVRAIARYRRTEE